MNNTIINLKKLDTKQQLFKKVTNNYKNQITITKNIIKRIFPNSP